jgi:nitric oxide reductase NorQ protein
LTITEPQATFKQMAVEEFRLTAEPFYLPISDEIQLFEQAYERQIPVLLKGPTGAGKTRFVEYMSWRLHEHLGDRSNEGVPLITVACHEDLTASDLVGRYLLEGDSTRWIDGPITRAVKVGAICYLDEIVEARKDTTVLIHPLTDYRRLLPIDKRGELLEAAGGFLLVMSYNPGYQSALKDLKHSTRQRFIAIEFGYPPRDQEAEIIRVESACSAEDAQELAKLAEKVRNLKEHGLAEGVSTRLLVYAGKLIASGISPRRACQSAVVWGLTDDVEVQRSIEEVVTSIFAE